MLTSQREVGAMQSVCAFVVQRCDCEAFAPCFEKDPEYWRGVLEAEANGVKLVALLCEPKPDGTIHFVREIPVEASWKSGSSSVGKASSDA